MIQEAHQKKAYISKRVLSGNPSRARKRQEREVSEPKSKVETAVAGGETQTNDKKR